MDADYALVISPVLSGPNPPEINGPSEGDIGNNYEFTFVTTDPEKMDVYYYIDWDDGTYIEWTGPHPSGEIVTISHTWFEKGNHSVKAKAKNSFGIESSWSEPYIINIKAPELNIDLVTGGFWRVNIVISNIGGVEATNVSWNLSLEGGFIFIGRKTSGIIPSIPAGQQVKVKSNVIIGFGETRFNVNTVEPYGSLDFIKRGGKVFGIYIIVNQGGG